jgi:hypothetical protein
MHARTKIDEPVWPLDQGGENIGSQHIDGEDVRRAARRVDASGLAIADAGVVDHRIEAAQRIDLVGDAPGLLNHGHVSKDRVRGARSCVQGGLGACAIAAMQDHLVTLLDQNRGRHQSKTVGRTRNENLGHV